jgi:hypothetical protein
MNTYKSTLNKPDEQFLVMANNIYKQCSQHSTEWKIDMERLDKLNTLTTNANTAYAANSDKATRNLITSETKKAAFNELRHFLSLYIDYLEGNLSVPDEAIAFMGLRPRTRHVRQYNPIPTEYPTVRVVKQHDDMTVYVSRAEIGQPKQSLTHKGYHGFKLRWRFIDETVEHIEMSTRLQFTLRFNSADETRRVAIAAAWINTRLEAGPWSEDVIEIIG